MKKILRIIFIELAGLYFASRIASGMSFQNGTQSFFITGIALGIAAYLLKPIINLLLLPLTLITLGAFKIIGHTITLFVVDVALEEFEVIGFNFAGFTSQYFDLPPVNFEKGILAYLAFSVLIWCFTGFINWIRK